MFELELFEWTDFLQKEMFWQLNCVLMLNWIIWNRIDYLYKLNLTLNNLQRLICHKTQTTNCDVEFYSDLKRSTPRSLSSVEGCYVECVSPKATWHLTLHEINPGQDSCFGRTGNKQIIWMHNSRSRLGLRRR